MSGFVWKDKDYNPVVHGERVALLVFLEHLRQLWRDTVSSCAQLDSSTCRRGCVNFSCKAKAQESVDTGMGTSFAGLTDATQADSCRLNPVIKRDALCTEPAYEPEVLAVDDEHHASYPVHSTGVHQSQHTGCCTTAQVSPSIAKNGSKKQVCRPTCSSTAAPVNGVLTAGILSRRCPQRRTYTAMAVSPRRSMTTPKAKAKPKPFVDLQLLHSWLAQHGVKVWIGLQSIRHVCQKSRHADWCTSSVS